MGAVSPALAERRLAVEQSKAHRKLELELDHKQAAEIFDGGVNAFSHYEKGKTKPPLALVKLLKAPDLHPHLLDEVISNLVCVAQFKLAGQDVEIETRSICLD
ncbi:transcriptional regulator, XRE family [Lysobacter capsici]|uniref:type II toxin-antitoxin system MqsA family antitoxin n=1 Tax=Lysobacter capsici TaxID=435897 RepID=UPI000720CE07|nr:type II toxin-antitoxin system MqsA family antitoxin [Lysobacter capsici]ALN83708.1 transcriptional regulator, XRE family [Lysobacter capsici]